MMTYGVSVHLMIFINLFLVLVFTVYFTPFSPVFIFISLCNKNFLIVSFLLRNFYISLKKETTEMLEIPFKIYEKTL